jgi:hypothetical protein
MRITIRIRSRTTLCFVLTRIATIPVRSRPSPRPLLVIQRRTSVRRGTCCSHSADAPHDLRPFGASACEIEHGKGKAAPYAFVQDSGERCRLEHPSMGEMIGYASPNVCYAAIK